MLIPRDVLKVFMRLAYYRSMLKSLVLITIAIVTLTFNPYLVPQVDSSPESSAPTSEDNDDDNNDNDVSGPQVDSPKDDSQGTDSSLDGSGDDDNNDNGFKQTDEQNLIGDNGDASVDEEPPTSTERGGNPLEGLNIGKARHKVACEKYLKSLGGGDETNVGDIIVDPFETREEYCKRILGAGIDISNTTKTTISELMNQTGSVINKNNSTTEGDIIIREEGTSSPCIIIREEGTSSGPNPPQPQPSPQPSPKPC